jgi:mono/diheme cytochrome c family protein
MPAFSSLKPDEVWALVEYVLELGQTEERAQEEKRVAMGGKP